MTWKDNTVPSYVFDNIKTLNPEKEIIFFTDIDCKKFLRETYGKNFEEHFDKESSGAFKADFFRYAYLYEHGGYYTDIDIEYTLPIKDFFDENTEYFSIRSALFHTHIFQAILYTTPKHKIIRDCLDDMLEYGPNFQNYPGGYNYEPPYFGSPTERMFHNFSKYYQQTHDKTKLKLGQEAYYINRHACFYKDKIIAWSKYENYNRECFTDYVEKK